MTAVLVNLVLVLVAVILLLVIVLLCFMIFGEKVMGWVGVCLLVALVLALPFLLQAIAFLAGMVIGLWQMWLAGELRWW